MVDISLYGHGDTCTHAHTQLKQELVALRKKLLPTVLSLAEQEQCSHEFLTHFTFDLRNVEEGGRGQVGPIQISCSRSQSNSI